MNKEGFSYLVNINVGAKRILMIIRNSREVPFELIETMAKERINRCIDTFFLSGKEYKSQTFDQFYNKMIKETNFEIEDLNNDVEVYDVNLRFENNKIKNNDSRHFKKQIRQSKFNEEI